MGAFFTLVATCVVMFFAAMGAGMIPLQHSTLLPSLANGIGSPSSSMMLQSNSIDAAKNLDLVSAVGAGLLISTALAVVVPEGFHLLAAIEKKAAIVEAVAVNEEEHGGQQHGSHDAHGAHGAHGAHDHDAHAHSFHSDSHSSHSSHSHSGPVPHWLPGLALASGFFFMMALDALSAAPHASCGGGGGGGVRSAAAATTIEGGGRGGASASSPLPSPTSSAAASGALRALIVHAAADGLAVGASCAATASAKGTGAQALAWSVAAAMALHKAPAAFGLAATLASAQWSETRAKRGLLFFSLSSPLAALFTFFALVVFGGGGGGTGLGVAAALLFSGGTLVKKTLSFFLSSPFFSLVPSFSRKLSLSLSLLSLYLSENNSKKGPRRGGARPSLRRLQTQLLFFLFRLLLERGSRLGPRAVRPGRRGRGASAPGGAGAARALEEKERERKSCF